MNDIEKLSDSNIVFVAEFTLKQLVDGAADETKAELYVFRNGIDIFYIGISVSAVDRAFSHLVPVGGWSSCVDFRRFAIDNKPGSQSWTVQFYKIKQCQPIHTLCIMEADKEVTRFSAFYFSGNKKDTP